VDEIHAIADAGSAVLHVLRDRGDARPAPAPKDYIAKYKGKFDQGWDKLREETLKRQIELGVVPAGTKLRRCRSVKAWTTLSDNREEGVRPADGSVRRLRRTHRSRDRPADHGPRRDGELDNTLFFYIVGDNGASAEGGLDARSMSFLTSTAIAIRYQTCSREWTTLAARMAYNHFAVGWAIARQYAVSVVQADGLVFGGHAQWLDCPLAQGDQGAERGALAVHHVIDICPNGASRPSVFHSRSVVQRHQTAADRGGEHLVLL